MFFSLPNLSAQIVREMEHPEDYRYNGTLPEGTKADFDRWSHQLTTDHSYLSMMEGMSPHARVNTKDNPVFRMHGVVADYDQISLEFMLQIIKECPPSEFMPTWFVKTRSGNCRLVWIFERPVPIMSQDHWKRFMRRLNSEFQFIKWHSGLDEGALGTVTRYFEHGSDWQRLPQGKPVPATVLMEWAYTTGIMVNMVSRDTVEIPIEDLAKQVHIQFPGRWKGEFTIGAQGVRFWDPSADAPKGAWIRKDGVYCFTGTQTFMSWREIFGKEFVAKYTSKMVDWILNESVYDGSAYWVLNADKEWERCPSDVFALSLRARGFGLDGRKKGEVYINDALTYSVVTQRRVEGATEFVYQPMGIVAWKGSRYLNISKVKALEPTAVPLTAERMIWDDGADHFPFIHSLFNALFLGDNDDREQLYHFLSWLKYFYVNAQRMEPMRGQAVVIAGPPGVGKTLLAEKIVSGLAGGHTDGAKVLVDGEKYTALLTKYPLVTVDDSTAVIDGLTRSRFTAKLKRMVANPELIRDQKYEKACSAPFNGRIMVLCNTDPVSLAIIPSMESSVRDKISLFKTNEKVIKFPAARVVERKIDAELPHFARFLIEWAMPEAMLAGEKRFGVVPYHHKDLLAESTQQGHCEVTEILLDYFAAYKIGKPEATEWKGKATLLFKEMIGFAGREALARVSSQVLGRQLAVLEQASAGRGDWIKSRITRDNVKEWRISLDMQTALVNKEEKK